MKPLFEVYLGTKKGMVETTPDLMYILSTKTKSKLG